MSEEIVTDPEGQPEKTSGDAGTKKDHVSYESFQKALKEKKAAQEKLAALEAEKQKLTEEKMASEGKKDELLTSYKTKAEKLESELTNTKNKFLWDKLCGEVKREALANGCKDPEKLIKLISDDDLKAIEVGDDFSIDSESVKKVVAKSKQDMGYFFDASNKKAAAGNPSNGAPNKAKTEKDLFEEYIKSLK